MTHFDEAHVAIPTSLRSEKDIKKLSDDAIQYLRRKDAEDLIPVLGLDKFMKGHS